MNVIIQLSTYDGNKIQQGEDNMARPTRCRRICMEPAYDSFFPDGFLTGEEVIMTLDEYETIRLIDLEEYTQHECAKQMNISRTTTAEIYKSARYKMADSVVNGKKLLITGGNYQFCDGTTCPFCKKHCNRAANSVRQSKILKKEGKKMRIAVTYKKEKFISILDIQVSLNFMILKTVRLHLHRSLKRMDKDMEPYQVSYHKVKWMY